MPTLVPRRLTEEAVEGGATAVPLVTYDFLDFKVGPQVRLLRQQFGPIAWLPVRVASKRCKWSFVFSRTTGTVLCECHNIKRVPCHSRVDQYRRLCRDTNMCVMRLFRVLVRLDFEGMNTILSKCLCNSCVHSELAGGRAVRPAG